MVDQPLIPLHENMLFQFHDWFLRPIEDFRFNIFLTCQVVVLFWYFIGAMTLEMLKTLSDEKNQTKFSVLFIFDDNTAKCTIESCWNSAKKDFCHHTVARLIIFTLVSYIIYKLGNIWTDQSFKGRSLSFLPWVSSTVSEQDWWTFPKNYWWNDATAPLRQRIALETKNPNPAPTKQHLDNKNRRHFKWLTWALGQHFSSILLLIGIFCPI